MVNLAWRRVRWQLARPLVVGGRTLHERDLLEVFLQDRPGHEAHGEAAPLPGLHREDVAELPGRLSRALSALRALPGRDYREDLDRLAGDPAWMDLPPSLRCGLEGALLELRAGDAEPATRLGLPVHASVASSALVDENEYLIAREVRCVKIKVGRRDPAAEIDLVRSARSLGGPGLEIRLDANRAFTLEEATAFLSEVAACRPRWIEEPLHDPNAIPALVARTGVRVALDETLHEPRADALGHAPGVVAWVLKPARLGVIGTLAAFERAGGIACVVSSSFESPRGLRLLETLARCAPGRVAPGLGTADWFTGAHEIVKDWTVV